MCVVNYHPKRSPNSTTENNNNLNSLISEFSKLNDHLLILGDLNYPTINRATLGTLHNKENYYKICYSYPKLYFASACK